MVALTDKAVVDSKQSPPAVQAFNSDFTQAETLRVTLDGSASQAKVKRVEAVVAYMRAVEFAVREEIKERARSIFESISVEIQRFWGILQPTEAITDVRLLVYEDREKAIEVSLQFYGNEQDSPQLTLSEGQRNALGLCIFLAMANKAGETDRPVFLDDVVISFDREHRSRVAKLLTQEFGSRQIVLLTHDREWFFELQRMLSGRHWAFRRLNPYISPTTGITFSEHSIDLDRAKARALTDPEQSLADLRRIMDVALSEVAERIRLKLPHLRGDNNDHRTAVQFLIELERTASRSLCRKIDGEYVPDLHAAAAISRCREELTVWGNRGTHTFSASVGEATDLIKTCEQVLGSFTCQSCDTPIGMRDGASQRKTCECGILHWRPK